MHDKNQSPSNNHKNHSADIWLCLLKRFCPDHLYEEIEGDLIQKFHRDVKEFDDARAKRRLVWNVIWFFRPGILLRNGFRFEVNQGNMFQNYIKIATRNMMKNKIFSLINISGLAVGLLAFLLILQYVSFEMSYDRFYENEDEIYRVAYSQYENNELKNTSAKNYIGIRALLKDHFPEVKRFTGFSPVPANTGFVFGYQDKVHLESGVILRADSNFFSVFSGLLSKGNPAKVLNDPHNLVISEKMARKIFGDTDPINVHLVDIQDFENDGGDYVITGIMKDLPENTHFHPDFITVMDHRWDTTTYHWDTPSYHTYITFGKGTSPVQIESKLNVLISNIEKQYQSVKGSKMFLQPVKDIHLYSELQDELEGNGSISFIYLLSIVSLIILIMAWFNYINLETARFVTRSREIGIRRIIGSTKGDLALQFLVQYFMITAIAASLAVVSLKLIIPHFSFLTGIPMSDIHWARPEVWLSALGIFLTGSFLVGIYPAWFLARLNPVASIKGNLRSPQGGGLVRKSLVTIQFVSSLVLLAFLLVVSQQVDFMRLTNKKVNLSQVVSLENAMAYSDEDLKKKQMDFELLRNRLLENPAIGMVCSSSAIPGSEIGFTLVNEIRKSPSDPYNPQRYKLLFIDYDFIPLYGLKLKAGRNYSETNGESENSGKTILNESAVYALGFKSVEEALGQMIHFPLWNESNPFYTIIGIVEDYHHEAIKKQVFPTIFFLNQNRFQQVYYSVKVSAGSNMSDALLLIEKSWKDAFPDRPFKYFFLDDHYDRQFKSELHFGRIFSLFTGVAIFIACLGLLGMTLFETQLRSKELSIRKVLGATISNLVTLLTKDYFKLVFLSMVVSGPLIYYCAKEWLSHYPVRIDISGWFFFLPLMTILLLVICAAGFQTIKAASANPVDNLKYE